jgi:hypothetical protein
MSTACGPSHYDAPMLYVTSFIVFFFLNEQELGIMMGIEVWLFEPISYH